MSAVLAGLAGDLIQWHDTNAERVGFQAYYTLMVFGVGHQDAERINEARSEASQLFDRHAGLADRLSSTPQQLPHLFLLSDIGVPHLMLLVSPVTADSMGTLGQPPDYDLRNTESFREFVSLPFPAMVLTGSAVHPEVIVHFREHLLGPERRGPH